PRSTLFPYTTLFRSARGQLKHSSPHGRHSTTSPPALDLHHNPGRGLPADRNHDCGTASCATAATHPAHRSRVRDADRVNIPAPIDRKSTRLNSSHLV